MKSTIETFDEWIRHRFAHLNTNLEEAYFGAKSLIVTGDPVLENLKLSLVEEGREHLARILASDDTPRDGDAAYELLGNVGYYMGACHRHGLDTGPPHGESPLREASILANQLGLSIGVAPRFVAGHQSLFNRAVAGRYRTFTFLADEEIFLTNNGLGTLAYQQAAEGLRRVTLLGVSNPMATYSLRQAKLALDDVMKFNKILNETLDIDRFFYNIRPYYKSYKVGSREYRGANAGDFSAINEIDLLLGLCDIDDPFYQDILADKRSYMAPQDQVRLESIARARPLLGQFLQEVNMTQGDSIATENARIFLDICTAHGAAYSYHHNQLIRNFLVKPAAAVPESDMAEMTASGPPLELVIASLSRLSDLRAARKRPNFNTAHDLLQRLRSDVNAQRSGLAIAIAE